MYDKEQYKFYQSLAKTQTMMMMEKRWQLPPSCPAFVVTLSMSSPHTLVASSATCHPRNNITILVVITATLVVPSPWLLCRQQ